MNIQEKILHLRKVIGDGASSENEKTVAKNILEKYQKIGHDIDVDIEKVEWRKFSFKGGSRNKEKSRFLGVIISHLYNGKDLAGRKVFDDSRYTYEVELTLAEFIEINERFEFYFPHYQEEKKKNEKVFHRAYVGKNNLWAKSDDGDEERETTAEQDELARKAARLQGDIERAEYLKRLK